MASLARKRNGKLSVLAILSASLFGCAWWPSQRALRQCRFEPMAYTLTGLSQQGLVGQVDLKAVNFGKREAKIHRLKLRLIHNADTLARVQNDSLAILPPRDSLRVPMQVVVPFSALASLALPLATGQSLDCLLQGDALIDTPFGTYTVHNAFSKKMSMDLSQVRMGLKQGLGLPW